MKQHTFYQFTRRSALAAICFASWSSLLGAVDATRWTSADGVTIHATLAGWDEQRVFLVRNGHHYEVPLSRLTPKCVAKAKVLLGVPESGPSQMKSELAAPATRISSCPIPGFNEPLPAGASATRAPGTSVDRHGMPMQPFQVRTRVVRTTAYTCSESDHLIYGNRNALGTPLKYTSHVRRAAADWSIYPVGTTFRIKGLPYLYVVDDYGSALAGTGTIDIYQPDRDFMNRWGRRNVEVTVVRWGSLARGAEILRGRARYAHCRQMLEGIARQRASLARMVSR